MIMINFFQGSLSYHYPVSQTILQPSLSYAKIFQFGPPVNASLTVFLHLIFDLPNLIFKIFFSLHIVSIFLFFLLLHSPVMLSCIGPKIFRIFLSCINNYLSLSVFRNVQVLDSYSITGRFKVFNNYFFIGTYL